jgi:hypothetical protein
MQSTFRLVFGLALLLGTTASAQTTGTDMQATGTFKPAGPPDHPVRTQVGDVCIVDLGQRYTIDGTITGTMQIDYRIFVAGPCGAPPGTYDEQWIARGRYSVHVGEPVREGPLGYLASVTSKGRVEGRITLAEELRGTLEVRGNFNDGVMQYRGRLTVPEERPREPPRNPTSR